MEYEQGDFYDTLSEKLYREKELKLRGHPQSQVSRVMFELGTFNIAQSYVTSKIENRKGDIVKINIEGGRCGIELQETLFDLKGKKLSYAYLVTEVKQELGDSETENAARSRGAGGSSAAWRQQHNTISKILVRRLPIWGIKDWLLIYEDTLFLLAVKDAYDEMEIVAFPDEQAGLGLEWLLRDCQNQITVFRQTDSFTLIQILPITTNYLSSPDRIVVKNGTTQPVEYHTEDVLTIKKILHNQ